MTMEARFKHWVLAGVLGGSLSLLGSTGLKAEDAAPAPVPAPAPAPAVNPPAEVAPAAPAASDEDAKKLLDQQAAADKRMREEIDVQVQAHLEAGKRLFSAFEYEQARVELERAVTLDRSNAEAQKWLMRVNDVLGRRRDRIKSAVETLYGEQKIAVQERLAELDNRIDWGRKFCDEAKAGADMSIPERIRKYEQALQAFERANEIVKWMPPNVNVDEQQNQVARMIRETRKSMKGLEDELAQSDKKRAQDLAMQRAEQDRQVHQKKLNVLLDQAKALFEIGEYEQAMNLAGKILEQDSTNPEANTIMSAAEGRKHVTRRKWIDEEKVEHDKLQVLRADRMTVPHGKYIIYPDNWQEIAQRTGDVTRRRVEDPWKIEARKKLGRHVSFEFVDTPLDEALAFLDSLTKVNFILDPRVAAEGAGKIAITLRVSDMEMEMALKWILRLADLDYELKNQAVFITKKANLAGSVVLEIYDVRDLTMTVTDFPGPRLELGTANNTGAGAGGNPFLAQPPAAALAPADLATLIKDRLLPAEFTDPTCSIEESGGKLVVMQRPEIHDKIRQLLKSFRETQTVQVLSNVRYIDVLDGFLEQIGVHFMGLDAPPGQDYDPVTAGLQGLPNVAGINPLAFPSRSGLFPIGGGPGLQAATPPGGAAPQPFPSGIFSSVPWQFARALPPPYGPLVTGLTPALAGAASSVPAAFSWLLPLPAAGPNMQVPFNFPATYPPLLLRPRLDPNFPQSPGVNSAFAPANGPAGFRKQLFGPNILGQGMTQNLVNTLNGNGPLGSALTGNGLGGQGALFQFRFFNNSQTSAVLQALRKDQTSDQLIAPRLTQFNNQRAHVLVATQRSYIADYDVSGAVYDPVIRSFLVGVVLDLKPTVSYDRKYITMDVRTGTATENVPVRFAVIQNPLIPITLPIELPDLELRSVSTTVTVPDNGTLLFSGFVNDRKIATKSGIPFLSDLPVIGRIFSTNLKQRERRNLLIMLNSRVILFDEEEAKL